MRSDDSLRSADGLTDAARTRRRLLKFAATVAATAPLAALGPGRTAQASPMPSASDSRPIRRAVLVPRFGGGAGADWYPTALPQLADLGISTKVVSLLPGPTAPGIDQTVTAIAKAIGDDSHEIAKTILIGHSVGSRALLAYLSRQGKHRTFAGLVSVAGWFTVDKLESYPALAPWVHLDLDFASISSAAGPITVHLSDNDPFTADWRANAADWLGKLGAAVHIAHGAGHYMTPSPGPVLDTIHLASLRTIER
jgi:predicted alpha/beta hydrolase family esterase